MSDYECAFCVKFLSKLAKLPAESESWVTNLLLFIFCVPPPPDIRERTLERTNGMHRVNQMLGEEREHAWSYEPVNLSWGLTCSLRSGILLLFIIENSFAATAVRVHPPP